ncbi:hypothetical protein NL108_017429, partial [Boleophthalmus pectinirostris]
MASVSCVLSEDQLLCSICLEVFTDPVSTSCGHSFCKTCIYQHWDHSEQYQCPVCKEDFSSRPQLKTNTFMSEMVSQFRGPQEEPDHEESQDSSEAGGVPCDVCSEPRLRAVKSCLVCLASYCPTHLEPHRSTARLQRHHLICPVENLEERICQEHDKLLELFCKTEKKFICFQCTFSQHKDHPAVPLKEECERQQAELETLVKQRRQKIQEIQDSVKVNNKNADLEMAEGVKVFTDLMECVQKRPQEEPDHEESQDSSEAGGVPCDMCSEPRLRAVKSCLVCLASYCPTHLEPHRSTARLQRHHLICPVENLEERICQEHDKLLELFCKTEKKFICLQCTFSQHKDHPAVPLKEECERQQAELETLVKQRRQKIQDIQDSVKVNNKNADLEMAEGVKVFTDLMECVQKSLDQFKERITGDQKKVEDRASELIEKLEQEICVLQQRRADMKLVSEDHFSFIQTFSSVKPAPELEDWTQVKVSPQSYDGLVAQAVSELEKTLVPQIKKVSEAELRRVQQYEVDVTLDPDTVHPNLVLSHDNKQVKYKKVMMNYPDVPQRFSTTACVLGKQKFSSGRSYFQVQVKGKIWFLGVARESVERKGTVTLNPQSGYWTIRLVDDQYKACAGPPIPLSLRTNPETVGVFVDHDQGLVSFYDVDSADLLY